MVCHVTPYKIKEEYYLWRSCLVDAKRTLLFMAEQVFLLMGVVWSMHTVDTQCTVWARKGEANGQRIFCCCLNFSCLAIKT